MAHQIETMFYNREKPWHGLGVRVSEALTSEEALTISALDWNVLQQPRSAWSWELELRPWVEKF